MIFDFKALPILLMLMMFMAPDARGGGPSIVFQSTDTPPIWIKSIPSGGMGGEILRLISDTAGVAYSINYLPIERFSVNTAPYLVGDPGILTTERNRAIIPIGIYHSAYFYYRPMHDVINIRSLDDLSGHRLGLLSGTIDDRGQFTRRQIKVEEGDSSEILLRMLHKGRIDVAVMIDLTGQYLLRQEFPDEVKDFAYHIIPGSVRPIAIMVDLDAPNGKDIAQRYRKALNKVLHSRQYHEILQKYYGKGKTAEEAHETLGRLLELYESTWEE